MAKARILEHTINGGAVFAVPDSEYEILWIGPRAGLFFGQPRVAGGTIGRIEHPTADAEYDTLAEARAAVEAFIEVLATAPEPGAA